MAIHTRKSRNQQGSLVLEQSYEVNRGYIRTNYSTHTHIYIYINSILYIYICMFFRASEMDHVDGRFCFGIKGEVLDLAPLKLQDFANEHTFVNQACQTGRRDVDHFLLENGQGNSDLEKANDITHVLRRKPPKPFPENIFKESAEHLPSLA